MSEFDITKWDNPITGEKVELNPEIEKPYELQHKRMDAYNTVEGTHKAVLQQFSDDFKDTIRSPLNVSKNYQALMDIDVVPDDLLEEWKYANGFDSDNWLNNLNVATKDEIDEWRAKGKMGIAETAQRLKSLKSAKYVPFVGTTADVGYNLDRLRCIVVSRDYIVDVRWVRVGINHAEHRYVEAISLFYSDMLFSYVEYEHC